MAEIWKDIENYNGLYQVSNYGKIRSYMRKGKGNYINETPKTLIQSTGTDKNAYFRVSLRSNGKTDVKMVHRIVAETFIENANKFPCVNHIDGNKHNNRVENLEWCTHKANTQHAVKLGLRKCWNKGKKGIYSKETLQKMSESRIGVTSSTAVKIDQFDMYGNYIKTWESANQASKELGIDRRKISLCCRGVKYKKTGGFVWKYTDK
jgi:hypothetical protein